MISAHWLGKRQAHWDRLNRLLEQSRHQGLGSLTRLELQEMGLLYRQAAADLSALREDPSGKTYARSLNLLLSRAHNIIYSGQKSSAISVLRFFQDTWPRVFRRNLGLIGLATGLFVLGALAGLLLQATHPDLLRSMRPGMQETIDQHKMWTDSIVGVQPREASRIMTNNISVTFFTFASGITAGIFTVYMLVYNGLLLGVVSMACWIGGMGLPLWSFVAAHGILELPAIFIAGGAAFRITQGLLFPGFLSRRNALASAGGEAVRLLVGTIPTLVVAGTIEGFISPSPTIPWQIKFAISALAGMAFFSYLFFCARTRVEEAN